MWGCVIHVTLGRSWAATAEGCGQRGPLFRTRNPPFEPLGGHCMVEGCREFLKLRGATQRQQKSPSKRSRSVFSSSVQNHNNEDGVRISGAKEKGSRTHSSIRQWRREAVHGGGPCEVCPSVQANSSARGDAGTVRGRWRAANEIGCVKGGRECCAGQGGLGPSRRSAFGLVGCVFRLRPWKTSYKGL